MEKRDISSLSVCELKALAYDLFKERAVLEQNINTLQAEIKLKEEKEKEEAPKE